MTTQTDIEKYTKHTVYSAIFPTPETVEFYNGDKRIRNEQSLQAGFDWLYPVALKAVKSSYIKQRQSPSNATYEQWRKEWQAF